MMQRRPQRHWHRCNCCSQLRPVPNELPSPVFPIVLKEQCVSKNVINKEISIFSIFLFILRQKRAIALCETENSLAAYAIAPRSNSPSFKRLWRKIKAP
jgi:hypothetical protein